MTSPTQINERAISLHPLDNVQVVLSELLPGAAVNGLRIKERIPFGHKIATTAILAGQPIIKFGFPIGNATQDIHAGDHVHDHNVRTGLSEDTFGKWRTPSLTDSPSDSRNQYSINAYARNSEANRRIAIRNELWIVNTVACVNQTATRLAQMAERELVVSGSSVDAVQAFPHPYGCSQLGDDLTNTQRILAGLINHSHAAGVLVLGLGCENNRIKEQLQSISADNQHKIKFFNTQDVSDELEAGMIALRELAANCAAMSRVELGPENLILAMKCGGSDGLSGITANPLLGRIADLHCENGGTVLLTEVPEMFGAEQVLLNRCANAQVHAELIEMVNEFKAYFRRHDQPISENPSPGNRDGGITTLEEKSLGCIQKAGTRALIKQIVGYGETAKPGLGGIALVNSPGNDGVSTTALTTAGANIILFTTGRGTPLGAPVPTIKVSTNTDLANSKPAWIDFDAGKLIEGTFSFEQMTDDLYKFILEVAAGKLTKNEINGYREIAIWKTGVTL